MRSHTFQSYKAMHIKPNIQHKNSHVVQASIKECIMVTKQTALQDRYYQYRCYSCYLLVTKKSGEIRTILDMHILNNQATTVTDVPYRALL